MNITLVAVIFSCLLSFQLYALLAEVDASLKHPVLWKLPCEAVAWLKWQSLHEIDQQNFFGYTPLHLAVGTSGDINGFLFKTYTKETENIVNFLLANNANPNIKNCSGYSPFFHLVTKSFNSDNLVRFFLKHKADPNMYDRERVVLHYCDSKAMNVKRLKLLLDHKANPCLTVKKHQHSAPHLNLIDGQYPYEATEDREKQNLLLRAIPSWIVSRRRGMVMTFLLCMNNWKKNENTKYLVPPRLLQYKILDVSSLVMAFKTIEEIKNKDVLDKREKEDIKNMINHLIAQHGEK